MTWLYILGGISLFFFLLFTLPLHVNITASDDVSVVARVLFFRYSLFPMTKRPKKKKKKGKAKKGADGSKKASSVKEKKAKPKKKRSKQELFHLIRLLVRIVLAVLKKLPRSVRIRLQTFEITVATGDAAKTAVLYGAVAGAASNLFEILKNTMNFRVPRRASVGVQADFLGEKSKANIKIDFSTNLWKVLALALTAGIAFVKNKTKPEA